MAVIPIDELINQKKKSNIIPIDDMIGSQEQQPPRRKANILDLLGLAGTSQAETGGKVISRGLSGATFGAQKGIGINAQPETPGEKFTLPASEIAGAIAPISAPNLGFQAVEKGVGKGIAKFGGQAMANTKRAKLASLGIAGASTGFLEAPADQEKFFDLEKRKEQAALGGALGVAIPTAIGAIGGTSRAIGKGLKKAPEKLVDEVLATKQAHLKFGKNPARVILKKKLVSSDLVGLDDFHKNVQGEIQKVGQQLQDAYDNVPGVYSFGDDIKSAINKSLKEFTDRPNQSKDKIKKINEIVSDLQLKNVNDMTIPEAWELTKRIGSWAEWNTIDSVEKAGNNAIRNVYRNLSNKLESIVPDLKSLNQDYSDLLTASKAIEQRNPVLQRNNIFSPSSVLAGTAAAGSDIATGGVGLGSLIKGVGVGALVQGTKSPAFKLRLAQSINSTSNQKLADILSKAPNLQQVLKVAYGIEDIKPESIKNSIKPFIKK